MTHGPTRTPLRTEGKQARGCDIGAVRILFATAPGYGLMMPVVPLVWAAQAAGHVTRLATTGRMCRVAADAGIEVVDICPGRDLWARLKAQAGQRPAGGPPA